jgi:hypothetical protein
VTTRVLGPLVPSFFFLSHSILEGLKSRSPMTSRWMVRLTRIAFRQVGHCYFRQRCADLAAGRAAQNSRRRSRPRYKHALGGADAIAKVQSLTVHGEFEGRGVSGKASFVY